MPEDKMIPLNPKRCDTASCRGCTPSIWTSTPWMHLEKGTIVSRGEKNIYSRDLTTVGQKEEQREKQSSPQSRAGNNSR